MILVDFMLQSAFTSSSPQHPLLCMNPSRAADAVGQLSLPEAATCILDSQVPTLQHDAWPFVAQSHHTQSPNVPDTSGGPSQKLCKLSHRRALQLRTHAIVRCHNQNPTEILARRIIEPALLTIITQSPSHVSATADSLAFGFVRCPLTT